MNNASILKQIDVLRLEYSAADKKRKLEIMDEQNRLKTSLKRCSQCSLVLVDDTTGFCSEECRDIYWKPAKQSKVIRSKDELLIQMKSLKDRMYDDQTHRLFKKIFI